MMSRRISCWDGFQCVALVTLLTAGLYQLMSTSQHEAQLAQLTLQTEQTHAQCAQLAASMQKLTSSLNKLRMPIALPPQPPMTCDFTQKQNLYLGDGMVMCFVQPLGVHMVLEGTDKGMTPHLCRGLGWEPEISHVLRRLARPGAHILDVGTNVGYYAILFAQTVGPSGRVIGMEANPRTYQLAQRTLELLGYLATNTQLMHNAAYSTDNHKVKITVSKDRPLNNRVTEDGNASQPQAGSSQSDGVEVSTLTVDTVVSSWQRLDLIKIDVEGAESQVYAGMQETIRRFPTVVIVMEVNTGRMGAAPAKAFYETMQRDYPQLRRIVGSEVHSTSVTELLANTASDELLVLSRGPVVL